MDGYGQDALAPGRDVGRTLRYCPCVGLRPDDRVTWPRLQVDWGCKLRALMSAALQLRRPRTAALRSRPHALGSEAAFVFTSLILRPGSAAGLRPTMLKESLIVWGATWATTLTGNTQWVRTGQISAVRSNTMFMTQNEPMFLHGAIADCLRRTHPGKRLARDSFPVGFWLCCVNKFY